jgi:hypothetical protein
MGRRNRRGKRNQLKTNLPKNPVIVPPHKLTPRQKGLEVAALALSVAIGLASLAPADPYVVVPMLLLSLVSGLYWVWTQDWSERARILATGLAITTVSFVGARALGLLPFGLNQGRAEGTRKVNAHLEWRADAKRLDIAVINDSSEILRHFEVRVVDIRRRSEGGEFVQTVDLHRSRTFNSFLAGHDNGLSNDLGDSYPDHPLLLRLLSYETKYDSGLNRDTVVNWHEEAQGVDVAIQRIDIPDPGIWQITFEGEGAVHLPTPCYLYFEWKRDVGMAPWNPPQ